MGGRRLVRILSRVGYRVGWAGGGGASYLKAEVDGPGGGIDGERVASADVTSLEQRDVFAVPVHQVGRAEAGDARADDSHRPGASLGGGRHRFSVLLDAWKWSLVARFGGGVRLGLTKKPDGLVARFRWMRRSRVLLVGGACGNFQRARVRFFVFSWLPMHFLSRAAES